MKNIYIFPTILMVIFLFSCSKESLAVKQLQPTIKAKELIEITVEPHFKISPLSANKQAQMSGVSMKENNQITFEHLRLVEVTYLNFSNETKIGEIVVHRDLANEVLDIFKELYEVRYPIAGIQLIDVYNADDEASMLANNSSAFCYRTVQGTNVLSSHAKGMAIDINPFQNPHVVNGIPNPKESNKYVNRNQNEMGMIKEGDACYKAFTSRGWTWGGHWRNPDYQHFEKKIPL